MPDQPATARKFSLTLLFKLHITETKQITKKELSLPKMQKQCYTKPFQKMECKI